MNHDSELVDALRRLCEGKWEPGQWLAWWSANADAIAGKVSRGEWLRLKPPAPGRFGPPARCALVSQQGATQLLRKWQIDHELSDRYDREWRQALDTVMAEQREGSAENGNPAREVLGSLGVHFPKLADFLRRNPEGIEELGEPATDDEVEQLQQALGVRLPQSVLDFLSCTRALVYGDGLQIGAPYIFVHPRDAHPVSAGKVCLGDFWLDGDGLATVCQRVAGVFFLEGDVGLEDQAAVESVAALEPRARS